MPQPQPQLTGASYGPAIPPQPSNQQQPPPPPPPPSSCYCSLLTAAIKIFISTCVVFGAAVLILWIIFRPTKISIAVENASLTRFNLTTTPTTNLYYNLTALVRIRNPNQRISIYFDELEADAYYLGQRFGFVMLRTFYQAPRNTTKLEAAIAGMSFVAVGDAGVKQFNEDNRAGLFYMDLWLYGNIRYKFGSTVTRRYKAGAKCVLGLRLSSTVASDTASTSTDCDVVDY